MHRIRVTDLWVLLAVAVAALLLGPLRGLTEPAPVARFVAVMVLFMLPGLVSSRWFLGGRLSGAATLPVAFVVSSSLFALLGVPMLILHRSIEAYLWLSGAAVALAGAVVLLRVVASAVRPSPDPPEHPESGREGRAGYPVLLWIPFAVAGVALALISRATRPNVYDDLWVYIAWVREFMVADGLALREPYFGEALGGLSRAQINGWLLQQAALARVSGIDPINLVLDYLAPTLVLITLLAFYALARTLLKNEAAALLTACLYALFFLVFMSPSVRSFGGEFVARVAEDKFAARFIFLPVALIAATLFLERRRIRHLALFTLVGWSVVAVHPIALAVLAVTLAGFGLAYMAANLRRWAAWTGMVALAAAISTILLIPAVLFLTGGSFAALLYSADINSTDPRVLANMVFVRPEWKHILELGDGSYIMHPYVILNPAIAAAYLLGLPFLAFRIKRGPAAPLLFGVLVFTAFLVYVPPVATFVGNEIIIPGQLWRLSWPIPLAALLTLGWMAWETISYALHRFGSPQNRPDSSPGTLRGSLRLAPLAAVLTVLVVGIVLVTGMNLYQAGYGFDRDAESSQDQIFTWMQKNITTPSVVLAPDADNTIIPAYSASANVVSLRGYAVLDNLQELEQRLDEPIEAPPRVRDVQSFYSGVTLNEGYRILRQYGVDYVLIPSNPAFEQQLRDLPGFEPVKETEGYTLFRVDQDLLIS
ncbi:MAG: DUF6077 domain-containing protein [Rubrobacteraceae bacterium]